jgi:hypothetical protein
VDGQRRSCSLSTASQRTPACCRYSRSSCSAWASIVSQIACKGRARSGPSVTSTGRGGNRDRPAAASTTRSTARRGRLHVWPRLLGVKAAGVRPASAVPMPKTPSWPPALHQPISPR